MFKDFEKEKEQLLQSVLQEEQPLVTGVTRETTPCNRCYKRIKMVGSVGSPMRSQSLARLHAVRALYV